MKGVIFNVVEETVRAEHGEDAWDALLESAGLRGAYTSLGTYPDQDMTALVTAACEALDIGREDLLRHLGRQGFGQLAARNPHLMAEFSDSDPCCSASTPSSTPRSASLPRRRRPRVPGRLRRG